MQKKTGKQTVVQPYLKGVMLSRESQAHTQKSAHSMAQLYPDVSMRRFRAGKTYYQEQVDGSDGVARRSPR